MTDPVPPDADSAISVKSTNKRPAFTERDEDQRAEDVEVAVRRL